MAEPAPGLAILAGRGTLPQRIAEDRAARGLPYLVVSFGPGAEWMRTHPHQCHRFERPGGLFAALRRAGFGAVVFAGGMDRPRLNPLAFDLKGLTVAPRVLALMARGDDGLLSGLARIFEAEGFRLLAAQDCLPGLTEGPGVPTRARPSAADRADAARAGAILAALGPLDVAQAAVVARGVCLGVEAVEGTDALLARIAALPEGKRAHCPPPSGVLVKRPKPGQDRRADWPAIGPETVAGAAAAGLSGIAVEAGGALILERAETLAAADRAGLFLWSARAEDLGP